MAVICSQGHSNPDGSAFCDECGERLDQASAVATSAPAAAPAPSAPAPAPSAPATTASPRLIIQSDNAEEGGVSRIHAKILINGNQYLLEDENSTNSTFINRQKLTPKTPTPIKDGDELRFGRVVTIFRTS